MRYLPLEPNSNKVQRTIKVRQQLEPKKDGAEGKETVKTTVDKKITLNEKLPVLYDRVLVDKKITLNEKLPVLYDRVLFSAMNTQ